jgi:uncharacterized protein
MTAPASGARVERTDTSRLAKFPRTGAGAARLPATLARTGVQKYGNLLEYRPPEEVFAADSLASLGSVPVTIGHPPKGVTPENMRALQIGHVSDVAPEVHVKLDGSVHEWVRAPLVIGDGPTLQRLDSAPDGPELSCGYACELDFTPGVDPVTGEKYDAIQRKIRFNHVAVLLGGEKPRAGAHAKVRLDSEGNPQPMKILVIDGVEYEQGSEKHLAKLDADHKTALAAVQAKFDALQAQHDALKTRADADAAKADAKAIDARVEARMDLFKRAAALLPPEYETAGKSDAEIYLDAVTAKLGADAVKGKSAAYIEARFDTLVEAAAPTAPAQYHAPVTPVVPKADAVVNINDSDDAFRAALAKKVSQ